MTEQTFNPQTFAAMQLSKPFTTYKKKILGKVSVNFLSPWSGKPEGLLMEGDPEKGDDTCFYDTWSAAEDAYFTRTNKRLFDLGIIIKENRKEQETADKKIEQYSDDELKEIVNMKYAALQKVLSETTSPAVVSRMLTLAHDMDKSERIVRALEAKLSELQK
jgi:hypothetical protein